jgi:hypothetical protein
MGRHSTFSQNSQTHLYCVVLSGSSLVNQPATLGTIGVGASIRHAEQPGPEPNSANNNSNHHQQEQQQQQEQ